MGGGKFLLSFAACLWIDFSDCSIRTFRILTSPQEFLLEEDNDSLYVELVTFRQKSQGDSVDILQNSERFPAECESKELSKFSIKGTRELS